VLRPDIGASGARHLRTIRRVAATALTIVILSHIVSQYPSRFSIRLERGCP